MPLGLGIIADSCSSAVEHAHSSFARSSTTTGAPFLPLVHALVHALYNEKQSFETTMTSPTPPPNEAIAINE